ncbi:hypothetical protein DRH29_03210 [candidate division Kazan bacterium]|uniref:Uncharacterized protein n=1 Tax=candidate division Kazan bacterium TaxID=2202143 RepID=A0A420ZCA0_UNCK3|nr:MAG: hypothetical protein DRH29_03210 [candidate division Kazan bacterium]
MGKIDKSLVKQAENELEKEKKEEQIKIIKSAIKSTLEKIEEKKKERDKLSREIKILKQDIQNIRDGRLDLIEERQKKDEEARNTSVIIVEKEKVVEHHNHYWDRWFYPYKIEYNPPLVTYTTDTTSTSYTSTASVNINCSIAKEASYGSYVLKDGTVKSFN